MPTKEIISNLTAGLSEWVVYFAIAIVTLIGLCKCIYPMLRNAALLNRAVVKLEKSSAAGDRPAWREPRFLGRSLRPHWQQFLLNAGQLDIRGMPCDTRDYINEETVIEQPGHAQLAELIPSLLTSLGILGTFLGLMEGLTSVDFSNAEGTLTSIPVLLGGMRFAFATSVAGIACSLTFNMGNRIASGHATRALTNFEEAFYELAMPRPLDSDVQLLISRQDEEERMNRIAQTIGNQVAASLEMAMSHTMGPMNRTMDTFVRGATQEQTEAMRGIVNQFFTQMNASLNGQMTALSDTMNLVNQGQMQTQKNLQSTLNTSQAMTEHARMMQLVSSDIAKSLKEISQRLDEQMTQQEQRLSGAEEATQQLANQLTSLSDSLARMQQAVDRLTNDLDANQGQEA
ncbi:MAG: MotA/TolQ/ExbB proton channel family protein [Clostridia bacterium]|nr:MotA/TolQ/ExbB proton channel family protein [Clostridia bacterium]